MRALVLFNVDFCAWPLHILAALKRRMPALEADGVVVVDDTVTRLLEQQKTFAFRKLHCFRRLEPGFLATSDPRRRLAALEQQLGRTALNQIAIADRELSAGWVSGAAPALTPLARAARDPDRWTAYLAGLTEFLLGLIGAGRYDLVLSYPVQDAASVAAGLIADHHGIRFLSPKAIGFADCTCLFDDVRTMDPCFRHAFAAAAERPAAISEQHWRAAAAALAAFRARPQGPEYMSLANAGLFTPPGLTLTAALAWRTLTRREPISVRYPYPFSRLVWEWRRWAAAVRDGRGSRFARLDVLAAAPFAYYPLHYEPEASTLVSAPEHTNQIAVVEAIAKAVPSHWRIAVKEHRPMLGRRPPGYYRRLAAIPKVVLVTPAASTFELMARAAVTVAITSSAGIEAVLLQKPAVFLGPSPIHIIGRGFEFCPDANGLSAAIERALAAPPADDALLTRFLAALLDQSVTVPSRAIWGGLNVITNDVVAARPADIERFADLIERARPPERADGVFTKSR